MAKRSGLNRSKKKDIILKSNTRITSNHFVTSTRQSSNSPSLRTTSPASTSTDGSNSGAIFVNASSRSFLSQDNVTSFFQSVAKKQPSYCQEIAAADVLCPICSMDLSKHDLQARELHVNACIEGSLINDVDSSSTGDGAADVRDMSADQNRDVKSEFEETRRQVIQEDVLVNTDKDTFNDILFDDVEDSQNIDPTELWDKEIDDDVEIYSENKLRRELESGIDTVSEQENTSTNLLKRKIEHVDYTSEDKTEPVVSFEESVTEHKKKPTGKTELSDRTNNFGGLTGVPSSLVEDLTGTEIVINVGPSSTTAKETGTDLVPSKSNSDKTALSESQARVRMPFYKIIEFEQETIAVDAFNFGPINGVNKYFLSHFHSDHYMGLGSKWDHGLVYCTETTSRLIQMYLKVDPSIIREIPMDQQTSVDGLQVVFLDANHCPGSAIMLIAGSWPRSRGRRKVILHTGDFRASKQHIDEVNRWLPILRSPLSGKHDNWSKNSTIIDEVYLDTTYLNPSYSFPSQNSVLTACGDYCYEMVDKGDIPTCSKSKTIYNYFTRVLSSDSKPKSSTINPVIFVGSYTIGKERLAIHIAQRLNYKIFAQRRKMTTLQVLQDENLTSLLSDDGLKANVHIVSMRDLNLKSLQEQWQYLKKTFTHLLAFQPTGWTFRGPKSSKEDSSNLEARESIQRDLENGPHSPQFTLTELEKCRKMSGNIQIFRVPYSEHSSFAELEYFCSSIRTSRIIPTVDTSNPRSRARMSYYLNSWRHL
ncbi:Pso2p [Sugiyamaella lignohabitans]|uniref:Pso2p n=1 Tax=Sugiyamaella lignohabitans TaxID=796027 RepID=A0A167D6V4_9ASCO|nr:Pso2p [Sugiyamaella lignohabitans]ANB12553.1 Pso2p [Sugiyamaella lignohabitans]